MPLTVKVVVIAGGGAGGYSDGSACGGGGGAGEPHYEDAHVVVEGDYPIVIGAGGNSQDENGGDSSFDTITAIGGGHGGSGLAVPTNGGNGGSGGGGTNLSTHGTGIGGSSGHNGGNSLDSSAAGGGGSSSQTGGDDVLGIFGGFGGDGDYVLGITSDTFIYCAGGGGGGSIISPGDGGNAGPRPPSNDGVSGWGGLNINGHSTSYYGCGGGGAGKGVGLTGGDGGPGVVIIRYVTADFGSCTGGTITTDGADTIHTFTSNGTFTVVAVAPVVVDNSKLESITLGYPQTIIQNKTYACPAKRHFLVSNRALEFSMDNVTFIAVATSTSGLLSSYKFCRCTTGDAVVSFKAYK